MFLTRQINLCNRKLWRLGSMVMNQKRGIKVSPSDVRKGDWIFYDNKPMTITNAASTCSGRGSRNYVITMKCIYTGQVSNVKPVGNDTFEKLEIHDETYNYLYHDDSIVYLSHPITLDQLEVEKKISSSPTIFNNIQPGTQLRVRFKTDSGIPIYMSPKSSL